MTYIRFFTIIGTVLAYVDRKSVVCKDRYVVKGGADYYENDISAKEKTEKQSPRLS